MDVRWIRFVSQEHRFEHEHGMGWGLPLPGTNEVVHMNNVLVHHDQKGKGFGKQYHE